MMLWRPEQAWRVANRPNGGGMSLMDRGYRLPVFVDATVPNGIVWGINRSLWNGY